MKIASDKIREFTKYSRLLVIEDGPIVSGNGYKEGTRYRVEAVSIRWSKGEKPVETHVTGHRILKNGDTGQQRHTNIYWLDRDNCPGWLTELVKLPEVSEVESPAATIMNDIFANSPEFVEKMNAAKK